jgi:hypothetical protein
MTQVDFVFYFFVKKPQGENTGNIHEIGDVYFNRGSDFCLQVKYTRVV